MPLDNQYDGDEIAQDASNTLNKTKDLDRTQELDATKDNLFVGGGDTANVQDFASDDAKIIKPKKGKKKKLH